MTVTTRCYRGGKLEESQFEPSRVSELLKDESNLVWFDVEEPSDEEVVQLGEEFGFHPLTLEDLTHPHQRPKIEQFDDYFFLVAYGVTVTDGEPTANEMAMFVGHNYLVTVRKPPAFDIGPAMKRWESHDDMAAEGGGYLLYILLDEVVDGYFDILDQLEDRAEDIEDAVFSAGNPETVQNEIFRLKKDLLKFRRGVAPLREVLDVLQRRTVDVVTERLEPYYRDVYDHVLRVTDFVDSLRDLQSSALEASLAVVSNRLNEVMKKLTSWAAIILVPTFIAGVYGMNFENMPELRWSFGYPAVLGIMAVSAFLLYRMFKRRGWL